VENEANRYSLKFLKPVELSASCLVPRRMQFILLPRLSEGGEKFKTHLVMAHFPGMHGRPVSPSL
jgi:hypothetical protein